MTTFEQNYQSIMAEISNTTFWRTFQALKLQLNNRDLLLYGAGVSAHTIIEYCKQFALKVTAICDRKAGKHDGVFVSGSCQLPLISPEALREGYQEATVLISSVEYNDEIYHDLLSWGFSREQIIPVPFSYGNLQTIKGFNRYKDGYARAYDFFTDALSKQLVIDRMRLYLTGKKLQTNTSSASYYESDIIKLNPNEVYVDGGSYDGVTAIEFLERTAHLGGGKVYSFEPDPINYARTLEKVSLYPEITVVKSGLWSTQKQIHFLCNETNLGASKVSEDQKNNSNTVVDVISLDSFFENKEDVPTFIKMDIEGAEREALLGAKELIYKHKPKLAICAYHKPEDVYELAETIHAIRQDYQFALRQHAEGVLETILYAV